MKNHAETCHPEEVKALLIGPIGRIDKSLSIIERKEYVLRILGFLVNKSLSFNCFTDINFI